MKFKFGNIQGNLEEMQFRLNSVEAIMWAIADAAEFRKDIGERTENGTDVALDGLANFMRMINRDYEEFLEEAITTGLLQNGDAKGMDSLEE